METNADIKKNTSTENFEAKLNEQRNSFCKDMKNAYEFIEYQRNIINILQNNVKLQDRIINEIQNTALSAGQELNLKRQKYRRLRNRFEILNLNYQMLHEKLIRIHDYNLYLRDCLYGRRPPPNWIRHNHIDDSYYANSPNEDDGLCYDNSLNEDDRCYGNDLKHKKDCFSQTVPIKKTIAITMEELAVTFQHVLYQLKETRDVRSGEAGEARPHLYLKMRSNISFIAE